MTMKTDTAALSEETKHLRQGLLLIKTDYENYEGVTARHLYLIAMKALRAAGATEDVPIRR